MKRFKMQNTRMQNKNKFEELFDSDNENNLNDNVSENSESEKGSNNSVSTINTKISKNYKKKENEKTVICKTHINNITRLSSRVCNYGCNCNFIHNSKIDKLYTSLINICEIKNGLKTAQRKDDKYDSRMDRLETLLYGQSENFKQIIDEVTSFIDEAMNKEELVISGSQNNNKLDKYGILFSIRKLFHISINWKKPEEYISCDVPQDILLVAKEITKIFGTCKSTEKGERCVYGLGCRDALHLDGFYEKYPCLKENIIEILEGEINIPPRRPNLTSSEHFPYIDEEASVSSAMTESSMNSWRDLSKQGMERVRSNATTPSESVTVRRPQYVFNTPEKVKPINFNALKIKTLDIHEKNSDGIPFIFIDYHIFYNFANSEEIETKDRWEKFQEWEMKKYFLRIYHQYGTRKRELDYEEYCSDRDWIKIPNIKVFSIYKESYVDKISHFFDIQKYEDTRFLKPTVDCNEDIPMNLQNFIRDGSLSKYLYSNSNIKNLYDRYIEKEKRDRHFSYCKDNFGNWLATRTKNDFNSLFFVANKPDEDPHTIFNLYHDIESSQVKQAMSSDGDIKQEFIEFAKMFVKPEYAQFLIDRLNLGIKDIDHLAEVRESHKSIENKKSEKNKTKNGRTEALTEFVDAVRNMQKEEGEYNPQQTPVIIETLINEIKQDGPWEHSYGKSLSGKSIKNSIQQKIRSIINSQGSN